jgi:hypothetical protein
MKLKYVPLLKHVHIKKVSGSQEWTEVNEIYK